MRAALRVEANMSDSGEEERGEEGGTEEVRREHERNTDDEQSGEVS